MSEQVQGPLAGQSARAWEGGEGAIEDYSGGPAREGHLPASDAVSPSETHGGATVREEIQSITDIELSGETLTDEQRAIRAHGERHAVDMEVHPDAAQQDDPQRDDSQRRTP